MCVTLNEQPQRPKVRGLAPVCILPSLAEREGQEALIFTVMEASICPGGGCSTVSYTVDFGYVEYRNCTQSSAMTQITRGRLGQYSIVYCEQLSTPAVWNIVIVLNRPS